jgi:hypothetical protein
MELVLAPGDKLKVTLKDADGEFELRWDKDALRVHSDLADTTGRCGIIYEEKFSKPDPREKDLTKVDSKPMHRRKLKATMKAVVAHKNFTSSSMFLTRRPDESGAHGNIPDLGTFLSQPANTIVVLFEGRLPNSGLLASAKHTFVKSEGCWWPQPGKEPYNGYTCKQLEELIVTYDYGYAIYRFPKVKEG